MRNFTDVTCKRCGNTESVLWVNPDDIAASHVCPDGGRSVSFSTKLRSAPGPGERSGEEVQ
jgi:hypothetical protein